MFTICYARVCQYEDTHRPKGVDRVASSDAVTVVECKQASQVVAITPSETLVEYSNMVNDRENYRHYCSRSSNFDTHLRHMALARAEEQLFAAVCGRRRGRRWLVIKNAVALDQALAPLLVCSA